MASLGLGLAEGRQLWEGERKTAEENRRFLAQAGLFDMELAEKEEAAKLQQEENVLLRENKRALYANSEAMAKGDPQGYVNFLNQTNKDPNAKWNLSGDGKNVEFIDNTGKVIATKPTLIGEAAITEAQKLSIPADIRANMERDRSKDELAFMREIEKQEKQGLIDKDIARLRVAGSMAVQAASDNAALGRLKLTLGKEDAKFKYAIDKEVEKAKIDFKKNFSENKQKTDEAYELNIVSKAVGQPIFKTKEGAYTTISGDAIPAFTPAQVNFVQKYMSLKEAAAEASLATFVPYDVQLGRYSQAQFQQDQTGLIEEAQNKARTSGMPNASTASKGPGIGARAMDAVFPAAGTTNKDFKLGDALFPTTSNQGLQGMGSLPNPAFK